MIDVRQLSSRAAQALRAGRPAEAAALFQQLTVVEPDKPNNWFNLGWSLRAARRYEDALDAYGEALKRGVSQPEDVHVNRAVILSEYLHRGEDAAAELRAAVAANPAALPAWLNLGGLREDVGDADEAREAYRKALSIDGANGRAIARLVAIDVHEGRVDQAIAMARDAAGRPARTAQDAAEILFALGNALDAAGEYRPAFQAIAQANQIAAAARPAAAHYDAAAQERLVDALIAMPALRDIGTTSDRAPIFICGMFRSGSTLAEQLLGRHRQVTAGGELEFLPAMVREDLQPYPAELADAETERLRALREKYLEQLRRLFPHYDRVTDKRPDNFVHIGLINALFPEARIVHTVREPLDNLLSVYFLYFADSVTYSSSLDDIAHYYIQYRRLMTHWRSLHGDSIHDIHYDALVADPRDQLQKLVRFCGLDWDDACLDHSSNDAVRTASNWQVRKPLHRKSSGRWHNYRAELEPLRQRLIAAGLVDS